jgi:hypothetical protein
MARGEENESGEGFVGHGPDTPTPPSEEEVREVAEASGVSFDVARALIGQAILSETELPDGTIIDPLLDAGSPSPRSRTS